MAGSGPTGVEATGQGRWLTVVGTNDVHGRLERVAVLGGFVRILRELRARDGGGVLLVDAGDMWQGTLVSNLGEGAAMVAAYGAIGYDAAAIGNHEFDFGPVGPRAAPSAPGDDPRGALLARAAEASFPLLAANLRVAATSEPVRWPHVRPSTLVEVAGIRVGLLGATTEETLGTTLAANVADLAVAPLAETLEREARALRERGAQVVVAMVHAGGVCRRFEDPADPSSCAQDEEIVQAVRDLPAGLIDVLVAGHTHKGMAHLVGATPVVEAYAYGRAFSRVDLWVEDGRVRDRRIFAPQPLCHSPTAPLAECRPPRYEGRAVVPERRVLEVTAGARERAEKLRAEKLGPVLAAPFRRHAHRENALANLFTDLMRAARPQADVAVVNAGGLRTHLPAGPLTYGALYEAFPFDNRFAWVTMEGRALRELLLRNMRQRRGRLFVSGLRVEVRCRGGRPDLLLRRAEGGRPVDDEEELKVLASDFLVTGGDGVFAEALAHGAQARIEDGPPIREAVADVLRSWKGRTVRPEDFLSPRSPRFRPGADALGHGSPCRTRRRSPSPSRRPRSTAP